MFKKKFGCNWDKQNLGDKMDKVFIFWDDSNIFISAQQVGIDREGEAVRSRVSLLESTGTGACWTRN